MCDFFEFFNGEPAAIGGADQRAHAGARDNSNRNIFFFENLQHSDVRHAARKAAA
jgi:hypothetical protein